MKHLKASETEIITALRDRSKTLREIGRELGYSASWMKQLGSLYEIARRRGGDRKSPAARARFGARA